jgi:hypothetical protein
MKRLNSTDETSRTGYRSIKSLNRHGRVTLAMLTILFKEERKPKSM